MTKADILKKEILNQYKSVRQFSMDMNIPYSTLVTALDRGIEGMAYGTVIRICDRLSLNPVDFTSLDQGANLGETIMENNVMLRYLNLNQSARKKILEMMEDFLLIDKYRADGAETGQEEAENPMGPRRLTGSEMGAVG